MALQIKRVYHFNMSVGGRPVRVPYHIAADSLEQAEKKAKNFIKKLTVYGRLPIRYSVVVVAGENNDVII